MNVARDISEQKRREQRILEMNRAIQDIVSADEREELTEKAFEAVKNIFDVEDISFLSYKLGFIGEKKPGYREVVEEVKDAETPLYLGPNELDELKSGKIFGLPVGDYGLAVDRKEDSDIPEVMKRLAELFASNIETAIKNLAYRKELEKERDRFASLFRNTPDPVVKVHFEDSEPITDSVNPAFEEVFGYEEDEIQGVSLNDTIVPEHRKPLAEKEDTDYRELEVIKRDVRRAAKDGIRDFRFTAFPAAEEYENEAYGIYTDITENKRHQREIERQNQQLEKF